MPKIPYILPNGLFHNEPDLLLQIAESNEEAYEQLYHLYSPHVFQVAMIYCRNDQSFAEEIVQMAFIRIWEKRQSLSEVSDAENYLFILTRNIVFDHLKKKAREMTLKKNWASMTPSSVNATEQLLQDREYETLLKQAVNRLPPQQRKVYELAKERGMSHEIIAKDMGLSVSTVQTHLKLAMRSIRQYMNQYLPEYGLLVILLDLLFKRQ